MYYTLQFASSLAKVSPATPTATQLLPEVFYADGNSNTIHFDSSYRPVEVHGGFGNDLIYGSRNDDKLYGDWGNDTLLGGAGNDRIFGGEGKDTLCGNLGTDQLTGGAGPDQFQFHLAADGIVPAYEGQKVAAPDQIMDFNAYEGDSILIGVDTNAVGGVFGGGQGSHWLDELGGTVRNQANADVSDGYRGFVYDTSHDMLYFATASSEIAIAQVHTVDDQPLSAHSIQLSYYSL